MQCFLGITCGAAYFVGVDTKALVAKYALWLVPPAVLADNWQSLRKTLPHREVTTNRQAVSVSNVRAARSFFR